MSALIVPEAEIDKATLGRFRRLGLSNAHKINQDPDGELSSAEPRPALRVWVPQIL